MYRVVITGAESTGKTTLAEQLAAHFEAPLSREFVRDFVESIDRPIYAKDLKVIIEGQMNYESEACKNSPRIVFHDTNLLSNSIYAEYYFKQQPKALDSVYPLLNTTSIYSARMKFLGSPMANKEIAPSKG